ncbi:MAG TPA: CHASE2 domain-containing protein [Dongiaceae bacterium]|nr:CHASE2 domain-containing protein [Dongiaceae bacterium]
MSETPAKQGAAGRTTPAAAPSLGRRILRALPVLVLLIVLTWVFGHTGVLHKLETIVTDAEMRLNTVPEDSPVALVVIDDADYEKMFESTSPLDPIQLKTLIEEIAKGEPAVIAVDIDTSAPGFHCGLRLDGQKTRIVWEREIREVPEEANGREQIDPVPILGGQEDLDTAKNSSGIPLLLDDAEDRVTRRYRRSIKTSVGELPSFSSAIVAAYLDGKPDGLDHSKDTSQDLVIRFAGERGGTQRLRFSATKVAELSQRWPTASPIRGKIVLLGGSYQGQDRHDTPVGQLVGVEVMANVVETELHGGGYPVPSRGVLFLLELFEAFVLILLFHVLRLRYALIVSVVLIPVMAAICSQLSYGNLHHLPQFTVIVAGLLVFELYEHFRRTAVPKVYHDLTGQGGGHGH